MRTFILISLILGFFYSCSGGSGGPDSSVSVGTNAIDVEAVKKAEVEKIKEDLNSGSYKLTLEELTELKNEGVLSEADFQELSKLASNQ